MELNLHSFTDTVALRCKTQHNKKKKAQHFTEYNNETKNWKQEEKTKKKYNNITIYIYICIL